MRGDKFRHGTLPAEDEGHDGVYRRDRSEPEASEPLNPFVGWSIALVISLGLWWGLWRAIASLITALR